MFTTTQKKRKPTKSSVRPPVKNPRALRRNPVRQTRYRDRQATSEPDSVINDLWIRNKSDELAIDDGCWFDIARGAFTVWWIEKYCKLYEGDFAGEPLILRSGCKELDQPITADWYSEKGRAASIERAANYIEWRSSGGEPDWQYECTMRIFGWAMHSERWERVIRRFNAFQIWVPKKQKKTPTEAAYGVYLTCGDGEQGAKVFAGAKDGQQACIQMDHAIAMVEQSPELSIECKTNKNERSISHLPTRSKFAPMSSANKQTQQSKEGKNGSMLIDETHVVDRAFIRRVRRMGISRSEPIHGEVSTAGNDPSSYGKERQDYGRQVLAGAENNSKMFVAIYEAPQDLKPEDLAADPIKFGKMANPAWGHTAYEEEYLADYSESKRTVHDMADLLMYRLNIWQQVANAWLSGAAWLACGEPWRIEGHQRHQAVVALDMAKTQDMSSLTVTINDGGKLRQKTYLFTTEKFARDNQDKANFKQWIHDGHLIEIPGDTIKARYIKDKFDEIARALSVKALIYDKKFAQDFIEYVEDKHSSIDVVEFPQWSSTMARPIDDFEAAVIDGEVYHDNNPCLNWQAGNCAVKKTANGMILVKPEWDNHQKIDGMVTSVMSYWGATALKIKPSVYKRRGVLSA